MTQDAASSLATAGGPFDIIIADPPWKFTSNSKENPGRNAMGHYDCLPLPEIQSLPVPEIAAKNSLLLLWVTVPHLENGLATARAWGFRYVSELVWVKERIGTGFWARNRHEVVLICKRGKFPCPRPAPFGDSVIEGQQRQHSRKPDRLHEMVDSVEEWRGARKLEMFARESRAGYTTWGDQAGKFDAPGGPDLGKISRDISREMDLDDLLGPEPSVEAMLS